MSANLFSTVPPAQRVALTNENTTGLPAAELLRLSEFTDHDQLEVLDNATGAGVLVEHLIELALHTNLKLRRVVAGDVEENMLAVAKDKHLTFTTADSQSTQTGVSFERIDQQAIRTQM